MGSQKRTTHFFVEMISNETTFDWYWNLFQHQPKSDRGLPFMPIVMTLNSCYSAMLSTLDQLKSLI